MYIVLENVNLLDPKTDILFDLRVKTDHYI